MERMWGRDYAPDKRDRGYLMAPRRTSRRSRYWQSAWIGDQGSTSQCVGYAWAAWLHAPPIRQFLLPAGIYQQAQHNDEWEGSDYSGTSVRAAAKMLASLGVITEYRWAFDVPTILDTVLESGPVVIGVNWYDGMCEPDAECFINVTGKLLGGHAVLIDGVNVSRQVSRIKNSWGIDWGLNGRCWLRLEDLERLLSEDGEACIGVEVKPRP